MLTSISKVLIERGKNVFHFENNIRKVPHNYKLTSRTGFIIFASGHKVIYYLCTAKQSFIIFAQIEIVNYHISAFARGKNPGGIQIDGLCVCVYVYFYAH